jgi:hypothetical protein
LAILLTTGPRSVKDCARGIFALGASNLITFVVGFTSSKLSF